MHDQPNSSVCEISSTRLKLRDDLSFTPQVAGTQPYYQLEDPLNSSFFRLGQAEYTFVSLLDGDTTIQQALSHLSTVMPHHNLTADDAAGLCRWLVDFDLAHSDETSSHVHLAEKANTRARKQAQSRWNPLVFRWPLGRPDRMLTGLAKALGWIYSPLATVAWLILVGIGVFQVASNWPRFVASSHGIFASSNWLWLATCWIVLKIVHEVSHGVVCKRYGGEVRETGLLFIFFAPLAYVDVTSSWRFRSRLHKIHVAAAGMYAELLIAAVAAIVWSNCAGGWLSNLCCNIIVMAGITTLLFNANPLMKFDGYFILSDALSMPNLYVNGQIYLRYWARRYLLGVSSILPDWSRGHRRCFCWYGWMAFAWRMFIYLSLTITATALFHGVGLLLAAVAVILWFGLPTLRFCKYLVYGTIGEQPRRIRFALTAGCALGLSVIVLGFVPWPGTRRAPAVVEYAPHTVIRAASAGFVDEIHVCSGERVETDQVLLVLVNRQLTLDVRDLQLLIRQSEIRGRQHQRQGRLAAGQAEARRREGLQKQLAEKQSQVERLTVRAPCSGRIIGRDLAALARTYVDEGAEIMSLGDESQKEMRLSISQYDLDVFSARIGKSVSIDVPRRALLRGQIAKVIPRASWTPHHPALSATSGGPLPVKPSDESATRSDELLSPRFMAVVPLGHEDSRLLHAGQLATIRYRPCSESIGQHAYNVASRWIRSQLSN